MRVRSSVSIAPALFALLIASAACGSSATSTTAPSQIPRCGISLSTSQMNLPATGGSGTLAVSATRECVWSTEVDGGWLSLRSGASGQGEGTVEFAAAPNADPRARTGGVIVNGTRAQVTQAAAECVITLPETAADFPAAGGTRAIEVRTSSPLCTWTASADDSWIAITAGASGSGNGTVTIAVEDTTGPPRAGSLVVAGQRFSVTQSQGCVYAIDREAQPAPPSGMSGTVTVVTAPSCPWTAASNVPWITVTPATGSGPGPVTFTVAPTDGPQRTGTALIAGRLFTVTQGPGCAFSVQPNAHQLGAAGGTATVNVTTAGGCGWTATSPVPWITFQGPTSGSGPGSVTLAVAPTTGPARSAVLVVAGQPVTVSQSQGCAFAIAPESQSVGAGGGTGTVAVTAGDGCAWTATSSVPWATITAGASGSGNGEVRFSVAATTGPSRAGTLTIAGRTFTITQGEGCTYALSSESASVGNDGGQRSFDVLTSGGCAWTASTSTSWITIDSGASGTGNGTVRVTVAPNSGPGRSGSITAAGRAFTVTQGEGCAFALSPERQDVPASGGGGRVDVTAGAGCGWTATSNASWLTITSGASGSGNGAVNYTAAANAGPARSGTLTIAGRTFTVAQAAGCAFTIDPSQSTVPAGGGTADVAVSSAAGCGWTAASDVPWIAVTSGASGTGSGTVRLAVQANAGAARTGTATIAGQTFTVQQSGGCTYAISPTSQTVAASSSTTAVTVTAPATCAWTAESNVPWMVITAGQSGTGNGVVEVRAAGNPGVARTGTATIAGQVFTVNQESGCTFEVSPESVAAPAGGTTAQIDVMTAAGCTWTAASNDEWIAVTAGASGSGPGQVTLGIAASSGPARTGSAEIAGHTVTVAQDSGCVIAIAPTDQAFPAGGGSGSITVNTADGCAWTAVSNAGWIVITGGASGAGDGAVQFVVEPNGTGAARSGTIAVSGQTFTITQQ